MERTKYSFTNKHWKRHFSKARLSLTDLLKHHQAGWWFNWSLMGSWLIMWSLALHPEQLGGVEHLHIQPPDIPADLHDCFWSSGNHLSVTQETNRSTGGGGKVNAGCRNLNFWSLPESTAAPVSGWCPPHGHTDTGLGTQTASPPFPFPGLHLSH